MTTRTTLNLAPNYVKPTEGPLTTGITAATLRSLIAGGAWHANTSAVLITIEGDQARVCPDGSTPTATKGHLLNPSEKLWLTRGEADVAQFVGMSASTALQVTEYLNG